jgi:phospholipid transport system transporter-binding protein
MNRATAQLAERGAGRCALSGALTIETAQWLWRELAEGGLLSGASEADLAGVTESDSAGLALLVAWRATRRQAGGDLTFQSLPPRLLALAALTEAQAALAPAQGAEAAAGA